MKSASKYLGLLVMVLLLVPFAYAATVTGTVKGPDGASFRGAFVQAQNSNTKTLVSVLTDKDGRYRMENLPPGQYQLQVKAVGYRTDPRPGVILAADQNAGDVTSYINSLFGENSVLPKSPAEMPAYKDLVRSFGDDAMKIVYVEYDLPGPNRMPWSAFPDKDGNFWMPYYGKANKIGRL